MLFEFPRLYFFFHSSVIITVLQSRITLVLTEFCELNRTADITL